MSTRRLCRLAAALLHASLSRGKKAAVCIVLTLPPPSERARRTLRRPGAAAAVCVVTVFFGVQSYAGTVTFGSGANTFNMEFVSIGNPNNGADTTGTPNPAGRVDYFYDLGKFEVSEDMITKYNANFGTANNLVITTDNRSTNKPATNITWNEAARFVNWLNISSGGVVAYKYANSTMTTNLTPWTSSDTLDYDASNPYRSKRATYFLPSYNEWYKAAYYDPNKSGGAGYWDYATGSDSAPSAVSGGTTAGTAVYFNQSAPADVSNAGGLSAYGVMGLNGNAREWEESSCDLTAGNYNTNGGSTRGYRGGNFGTTNVSVLSSSIRQCDSANLQNSNIGFRVASWTPVPGPLPLLGAAASYGWSRQLRKRIKLASSPTSASNASKPS